MRRREKGPLGEEVMGGGTAGMQVVRGTLKEVTQLAGGREGSRNDGQKGYSGGEGEEKGGRSVWQAVGRGHEVSREK